MIRKRILLASLLKPVSDTRLYEKIGRSMAKLPEVEVHVAGFKATIPASADAQKIRFHPIFQFKRLSIGRIKAQIHYWRLLNRIQPNLLVVGTHELLPLGWLYCKLHPCQLVYDVQENYYLNLTTQGVYSGFAGKLLGQLVRGLEKALAPGVRYFFLAEKSYAQELPFLGDRYSILQNKYLPSSLCRRTLPVSLASAAPLRLLYSGTISKLYGVLEAVEYITQIRHWVPSAELTIIGYCADKDFLEELKKRVQELPYVTLMGGDTLVPHTEILAQEQLHQVGLLPYHPHPSTFNCVPTKLFEYLGNGLVVVTEKNLLWEEELQQQEAGLTHTFSNKITPEHVELLLGSTYYQKGIPEEVFWDQEEEEVQQVVKDLLQL